ncbi:MAG: deoxyribodipyrimidine photo-lyase [Verrucomicrobiota bacterium]
MATAKPTLLWFRLDLRLSDNLALAEALAQGGPVQPVFILDDKGEGAWPAGGASRWWLHHALADLAAQLETHGLSLVLRHGASQAILRELLEETGASAVYWNRRYEPAVRERDEAIKSALRADGIDARSYNASLLNEPWEIQNKTGKPFQVFTPYWKHCQAEGFQEPMTRPDAGWTALTESVSSLPLDELGLLPETAWDSAFYEMWEPTRAGAEKRLTQFIDHAAQDYGKERDRPDRDGTSRLSPYLHFGQLGPREIMDAFVSRGLHEDKGGRKYLAEIGWREFSYHLMYHFPDTPDAPLRPQFEEFPWQSDATLIRAWQRGQTGYPIVDAGMRQLWATGWMHNRVRMIVASLLVKHLLQPWQEGARWFWDTLVDADLASNTQGWQWTAGCGADAAPYFRIFNPMTQGEKFDPEGEYVRRWVPELKYLPPKFIHRPWEAPLLVLNECGVELGETYPEPIVGHFEGRSRALDAFEKLKTLSGKD